MLFKDTVYTPTGIFKGHTNGTCGEGAVRINIKHSMDMLFVSPLSLGVRCSHIHGTYIAVLVGYCCDSSPNTKIYFFRVIFI
jgi:hypothetical protein